MTRLLIVCPVFRERRFCERWRLLTQLHDDVDVTLLAPRTWSWGDGADGFGKRMTWRGEAQEEERFRVRVVGMPVTRIGWVCPRLPLEIARLQPHLVYYIGYDAELALAETILAARLFAPRARVAAFTMRGLPLDLRYAHIRALHRLVWSQCDAIFCHYPDARRRFREEGFRRPVYIQTQIGVDARLYRPDETLRAATRQKYGLGDAFVFGSATRLSRSKGVLEILQALPREGNWRYLMLGGGPPEEEGAIRAEVARLGLDGRVIPTGVIGWQDMPAHWNAMDCAVHVPRTTPAWIDTFPIAVVQAMACAKPVIGNTSGAVPYQLGPEGRVVPEGDVPALRQAMLHTMGDPGGARLLGERMRERVLRTFDITHLSHCFHATMLDVLAGTYDERKADQAEFAGGPR
jgi:glycosyltransferase involved in cell wall biosynthesis